MVVFELENVDFKSIQSLLERVQICKRCYGRIYFIHTKNPKLYGAKNTYLIYAWIKLLFYLDFLILKTRYTSP